MSDNVALSSVDAQGAFTDAMRTIVLLIPKFLLFVLILVVGFALGRLLLGLVDKLLERIGFDRWVERGGIRRALAGSKYDASDIVARLVYYAVLLFTLQLAFGVWGPNPVSDLIRGLVAWLPRAIVAVIIVVVAAAIASWVRDLISGALGGLSYGRLLANIAAYFIIGLGIIAALNQIGVATSVTQPVLIALLATIAGILIVGVGGGLVAPMSRRWEAWLERAATESRTIAERARTYAAEQQRSPVPSDTPGGWPAASMPTEPVDARYDDARSVDARYDDPRSGGARYNDARYAEPPDYQRSPQPAPGEPDLGDWPQMPDPPPPTAPNTGRTDYPVRSESTGPRSTGPRSTGPRMPTEGMAAPEAFDVRTPHQGMPPAAPAGQGTPPAAPAGQGTPPQPASPGYPAIDEPTQVLPPARDPGTPDDNR
jgi:hypothetical protein